MKKQKLAVILFFVVLFVLGAVVTGDYGMPFDEKEEQGILNANVREYMIRFGLEKHIPEYTEKKANEYRIATSYEKDHGIACYYPIGLYILNRDSHPTREVNLVWQAYTYCLNFIGILAAYGIVRRLTGRRLSAAAAALILFLCPRMFAEMHYNNKDMVCLMLNLVTLYFGVCWILENKRRFAVGFGIASAFAVNARLISVFAFGLVGLNILIPLIGRTRRAATAEEKTEIRTEWCTGWIAIGVCILTYTLITPALWSGPLRFGWYLLRYTFNFSRWDDPILFAGSVYQKSGVPLPRIYLPVYMGITTPVWAMLLILAGTGIACFRAVRTRLSDACSRASGMVATAWLFPVLLAVAMHTHIYNGWRQFYFVFGPMAVMAGLCVDTVFGLLREKKLLYGLAVAALAGCMAYTGAGLIRNHPYQYAYVNALAGGDASERYELDYWHLSSGPMIRKLMDDTGSGQVSVSSFEAHDSHALFWARRQLTESEKERLTLTENDITADYLLVNLSYRYRIPEEILAKIKAGFHVVATASAYGNPMMLLYGQNGKVA